MKSKTKLHRLLVLAGSALLTVSSTSAATVNWEGDVSNLWGTAGNWNTAPANSLTADIANFNLGTYGGNPVFAPTVGTVTSINGITIGAGNGTMTLTNTAALSIGGSGISIASGAGAFTISGSTTLGAAQSWTNNSTNLFTMGAVTNGANLLTIGGSGNTSASGVIGNGAGGLTKEGAGILTLNAANTFTGTTTVNAGELRWGITNALSSGNLTVNSGGIVNMQNFNDTVGTITLNRGTINISYSAGPPATTSLKTGSGGFVTNGGTVNSWPGIGLGGNFAYNTDSGNETIANIASVDFNGASRTFTIADGVQAIDVEITTSLYSTSGNPNFIKAGAGTMQISSGGANVNYGLGSGTTTIQDGVLLLNKNTAATVSGGAVGGTGLVTVGDGTGSAGSAVLRYATTGVSDQIGSNAITIVSDGIFDLNGKNETTTGALTHSTGGALTTGVGTLTLSNATNTISGASTVTGNLTFSGTAATNLTIGGTANINGTTTFSSTGGITATGNPTIQGTLALGSAATHTIAVNSGITDVSAVVTGSTGTTTKNGAGTLTLSGNGANTYSGTISLTAGTLSLNKSGTANAIAGPLSVVGGTVQYSGTAGSDQIADNAAVTLANGAGVATLDLNGVSDTIGTLTIGGASGTTTSQGMVTTGSGTLTLSGNLSYISTGSGAITHSISGKLDLGSASRTFSIQNNPSATELDITAAISGTGLGIIKTSSGTLSLSGANTYSGPTAVNAGTLLVNSPGSLAAGSVVTVASGATLGGSGNINGTVSVNGGGTLAGTNTIGATVTAAASGIVSPAGIGAAGTLNLTNAGNALTLNSAAVYCDVLSNDGSSRDQMAITGNLVLNGTTTLFINAPVGIAAGNYTLMTFAAKTGPGSIVFPNGSTTMGNLTVTVNATDVTLSIGVGGANGNVWSGAASYVWDGGALNWTKNGTPSLAFADGDAVTFDDTGAAASTITSVGTVSPGSVFFNNSSNNYTVSATIGGTGTPVIKNGSGTVTLSTSTTANTYTGGTTINAGTLQGTTTSTSLTPPNPLSTGAITLNGSGNILQLRASGTLNTTAETIQFDNNVNVGGDATIDINRPGATSTIKTIQLGTLNIGSNTLGVTGGNSYALRFNGATTLTGNATFNVANIYNNNPSLTLTGAIGDGSAGYSLTKTGSGTLALSGANTFSGGVFINAGVLRIASAANLGDTANVVTFTGAGTLESSSTTTLTQGFVINEGVTGTLYAYDRSVTIDNSLTGSGTLRVSGGGTGGGFFAFASNNNTFSGNIEINSASGASYAGGLTLVSLADTSDTYIKMSNTGIFTYGPSAVVPLVLNNRKIDSAATAVLNNNATNVNSTVTVNTDLVLSGAVGNRNLTLGGSNTGNNTFAGAITNGAGYVVSLTKAGAGRWILSNTNNSYTGATTISGGTLSINSITNIGPGTSAIGAPTTVANGTIAIGSGGTAGTLQYTGSGHTTDRVISLAGNTGGVILDQSGTGLLKFTSDFTAPGAASSDRRKTLTLQGSTAGIGEIAGVIPNSTLGNTGQLTTSLTKTGSGTWILSDSNTYTGTTAVSEGKLVVGADAPSAANGALGNATSDINLGVAGGNSDADLLIGGAFTVGRNIRLLTNNTTDTGTRVLTIGGNSAAISEFSGNIILGTNSQAGRGVTLTAASGGQVTFSGVIQNPTSMDATTYTVTKAGPGTVILSNTNTYTGGTTVTEGTLRLGANDALPNGSAVSIGTATLDVDTSNDTAGTLTITGSAVINLGSGGAITFANSSATAWSGSLNITGTFVSGASIRFGTSAAGLTTDQKNAITVNGNGAGSYTLDADGYVVGGESDTMPPTLTSINDNVSGGPVDINTPITYTATFSEDINASTVSELDFGNAGTAPITIGTITETSPGVFTVVVTPTNSGSVQLRINPGAVIEDTASIPNALVTTSALLDDTTITVRTIYESWANSSGATGGKAGDPDGDGFNNLMEFAFDTNPTTNSAASIAYSGGVVTAHGQPILMQDNGAYYAVFGRRVNYLATGLVYTVQFSAGLNQWEASSAGMTTVATDGVIDAIRVPFPNLVTTPSGPKKPTFFRLLISEQ